MIFHIARFISFISNPFFLLFPIPYLLLYRVSGDPVYSLSWALYSWAFLFIIGVIVLYLVHKRVFTDIDVSHREQRPLLYEIVGIVSFIFFLSLLLFHGPRSLMITTFIVNFGIFVLSLVNSRTKASVHVATASAVILVYVILFGGWFLLALPLIPLIGWARVKAHRHTIPETLIGGSIGILLTMVAYGILKYIFHTSTHL